VTLTFDRLTYENILPYSVWRVIKWSTPEVQDCYCETNTLSLSAVSAGAIGQNVQRTTARWISV